MLETVKYLLGSAGPSGFGSKTTAEQVTENHADLRSITAIITGYFHIIVNILSLLVINYKNYI